jgi:primosomal protein N' (replication factor Y)
MADRPVNPTPDPAAGELPGDAALPAYVEVAVPLPLPRPLVYEVPPAFAAIARPGARARVPVGRRQVVGVVVARRDAPPAGVELRPLSAVLDREPPLSAELLELAAFAADYYLEAPGEVLRSMLPADLPPWGDRRVWLTDGGALARPRDDAEAVVLEALRGGERMRLSELEARIELPDLARVVEVLERDGRLATSEARRRGSRYVTAVELAQGGKDELLERCGRSRPGRRAVEWLAGLGRPATIAELTGAVGCGDGVVRRLVQLGVLRRFTQVERVSLGHHRVPGAGGAPLRLRPDQAQAAAALVGAIGGGGYRAFLLDGMTGSGKTEVYLRGARAALEAGRGALILVPEIALVPALAGTIRDRFGRRLALLHSGLSRAERHQEWERIRHGEARIVLGPRSAVFAPLRELGLIVIDEEQDGSYKQGERPRYNGRDLALVRARAAGATALVVSATPSLETRRNIEVGKLTRLTLTTRVGRGLPEGILVDLREEGPKRPGEVRFSERLLEELTATLEAGDQAILLRNRRGFAPVLLCRACGEDMRCDDCGLPRTLHKRGHRLQCHYCGSQRPVPRSCPECGESALEPIGAGTERVEERFAELFPGVAVDVLDRDTLRQPGGVAPVLERFAAGESQVLIGTQMVSKGHHFPGVALAAMLLADTYLGFPDFRAVERTYTLLTQLAGRAGRGDRPGKVVIQSYHPDHYAIQAALTNDDPAFAEAEMRFRRIFRYPPFTRMIQLLLRDTDRERGAASLDEIAGRLRAHPLAAGLRILGPAPAPFERLRGRWRFQLLLRGPSGSRLRSLVREVVGQAAPAELMIDVDPYDLL